MGKALRILNLADYGETQAFLKDASAAGYTVIHQVAETPGQTLQALNDWVWDVILAGGRDRGGLLQLALEWYEREDRLGPVVVLGGDGPQLSGGEAGLERCTPMVYSPSGSFMACLDRALEGVTERRRYAATEKALRESEARYRAVVEDQAELVCRCLPEGRLTFANAAFARRFHSSPDEILGRNLAELLTRRGFKLLAARMAAVTPDHPASRVTIKLRTPEGGQSWIEWAIRALYGENGAACEFQFTGRDVTDERRVEDALKQERNFLSAILRTASVLVLILDGQGRITGFNHAGELLTGYTFEEVRGKSIFDLFIPPEELAQVRAVFDAILTGEIPARHENSWLTRRGELRIIDWTSTALLDETGKVEYIIATGLDVTHRKAFEREIQLLNQALERRVVERTTELEATVEVTRRTEDQLQESQARFRAVFEGAPIGIVLSGWDGRALEANPAFLQMLGYAPQELSRMHFMEASHPDDIQPHLSLVQELRDGRRDGFSIEKRYLKQNGEVLWGRLNVSLVRDASGAPSFVISMLEDITERKAAEHGLQIALDKEVELNELKSRFISMTSHEFRTPLSTILSSSELLEHYGRKWPDEKRLQHLHRIQQAVSHLSDMLNDILVIGRSEAGRVEPQLVPLDLVAFCQNLAEEIYLGEGHLHEIRFTHSGEIGRALVDERLLRQALSNLLMNAIKYSDAGKPVDFTMALVDGQITFTIRDEGIGVPAEDMERLGDAFFRARNVGHRPGTGLGLTVVKRSVDALHGEISFSSRLGEGSLFTLRIPFHTSPDDPATS